MANTNQQWGEPDKTLSERERSEEQKKEGVTQQRQQSQGEQTVERTRPEVGPRRGLRGTAAMSRNRSHMAEIGRKGGQTVSKNREHMASIGRKGGEASRGHRGGEGTA
jgi:uncharacterized protein